MFDTDNLSALEAQKRACWISFAPMIFQSVKSMLNLGILQVLKGRGDEGMTLHEIGEEVNLSIYGTRVLLHAGLGSGVVYTNGDKYCLTKVGYFLLSKQTPSMVNIDFVNDVCYQGLYYLEDSVKKGKPIGLKVLGGWPTIYEGLSELPEKVKKSWLDLDHYFSDISYHQAYELLNKESFGTLLDLGGNTGKFCRYILEKDNHVTVTIADLPGQIKMAKAAFEESNFDTARVLFQPINILDNEKELKGTYDIIWMSQFLDCFHEEDILKILRQCKKAINKGGSIFVQDAFWDRQRFETSAFSLQQFSLYFTALANGRSQMYDFKTFEEVVTEAGLVIAQVTDDIGISNSVLKINVKE